MNTLLSADEATRSRALRRSPFGARTGGALWLSLAVLGCNADHYYCRGSFASPGSSGSSARCAIAANAEEVCRGLTFSTPPPEGITYRTAGPYGNRENCEVAGPLDSLRSPADAGRP